MIVLNPPEDSPLFLDVPCIVQLDQAPGAGPRYYGPFPSLKDAKQWCEQIQQRSPYMSFGIIPLRRTDRQRGNEEWYGYNQVELDDFFDTEKYDEMLQNANDRIIDV